MLIGITALVVIFRRRRYLPVGWFWFLGTLVPVIGLVQVGEFAMADRYAYVPLIGIFIMICLESCRFGGGEKSSHCLAGNSGTVCVGSTGLRHSSPDGLLG